MTKFNDLPQDLAEEILCRVPATNLKRLRSTSKQWNSLFNNKSFAKKHFAKAVKESLPLFLTEFRLCSMSIDIPGEDVEVKNELSLFDPDLTLRNTYELDISTVFHCEGLLLCTSRDQYRVVVWNPCTGQTRWIKSGYPRQRNRSFVLGYCRQSGVKSYKILSFSVFGDKDLAIYELSSDSWRPLNHDIPPGWSLSYHYVSLNGDTYLFAKDDEPAMQRSKSLLRFDFTTEKFVHVPLPYYLPSDVPASLSVVREEKLAVLLKFYESDVWLTNKIDETKVVTWSKVLSLDLVGYGIHNSEGATFLLDEEKKAVLICERWLEFDKTLGLNMVYIYREDNTGTPFNLADYTINSSWPTMLSYVPSLVQIDVPSLVQIEGTEGNKRKGGD